MRPRTVVYHEAWRNLRGNSVVTPAETLTIASHFLVLSVLAVYGWHRYYLVYLYVTNRERQPKPGSVLQPVPIVTIQLPLYNEVYVADRLINAVCAIEYPRRSLEIQVLDDSTDETRGIAERAVRRLAAQGVDIKYFHRTHRTGYKAGALQAGLRLARGEFVAIFDADFVPGTDFLTRLMPYFSSADIGMVQARWGHINRDYSLLTKIQAILLDGHFVLEHGGRNRSGCFFNFNGTGGIWRRRAIDEAGGWQHDTLTEDLDLSYRAQLCGWRFVFVPDAVAPAEVPVEMNAFKSQQHRWAKGSIQTCRKLLPRILRADLPVSTKVEACFHLAANFNYILICLLSILIFPSLVIRHNIGWKLMPFLDATVFVAATFPFFTFYMVSQRELHPHWSTRVKHVPLLMLVGIGLSINNARAVIEAVFRKHSEFVRTPKYGVEAKTDEWMGKKYRQSAVLQTLIELALGLYFTATVLYAVVNGLYGALPFLVLFQVGFLYTSLASLAQQYAPRISTLRYESVNRQTDP